MVPHNRSIWPAATAGSPSAIPGLDIDWCAPSTRLPTEAGSDVLRASFIPDHRDVAGLYFGYVNGNMNVDGLVPDAAATGYAMTQTGTLNLNSYSLDRSRSRPAGKVGGTSLAAAIALAIGWGTAVVPARAQSPAGGQTVERGSSYSELLSPDRDEVADEERQTWTVNKIPPQQFMKEIYWDFPEDTAPFFRDSLVQIVGRTYDLTRDNATGSRSQAWAAGGWLLYRSGLIADLFGVQGAFYTSQKLLGPSDEGGTKLLTADQKPLNALGQAYVRLQAGDQEFRGGRQLVDTPLINPQDSRMVPNTFEGVTLDTLPDRERSYDYAIGYLTAIKQRDSNTFVAMSDALAGGNVIDRGASFGMVKYRPWAEFSAVAMDYWLRDFVNTGFVQAEYDLRLPAERPNWVFGANLIDQSSVGKELLTGSSFHTYQASGKVRATYAGWTLFVAGSATGDGSKIFSPFGSKPNYTDMQQVSFDNAGENAFGGSLAYDFGAVFECLSGLSAGLWDTQGWGARTPGTGGRIADRNELDLWLQYRPNSGPLQGFRLKTQYSDLWQPGNLRNPQSELRVVLDYTVLLRPPVQ